jgi:hypothetical protein
LTSGAAGTLRPVSGALFDDGGPTANLVQGQIGDCWLVSTADVIAAQRPALLRKIIRDNNDGTFTVTFKRYDHDEERYVDVNTTVTSSLYTNWSGKPTYGATKSNELWFPILEKAYAKWKGGYDGARSGYPFEAFEALLGNEGRHFDPDVTKPDDLYDALEQRLKNHEAVVAWTRVDTPELNFANTGLAQDHAYAVLGVERVDGKRFVKVRNPWGNNPYRASNSPLGLRALDNAMLLVPLEAFVSHFSGVGSAPT